MKFHPSYTIEPRSDRTILNLLTLQVWRSLSYDTRTSLVHFPPANV